MSSTEKKYSLEQVRDRFGGIALWLKFLSRGKEVSDGKNGPIHQAIRESGHYDAETAFAGVHDLAGFVDVFESEPARDVFDMEEVKRDDSTFEVKFHTCPLVKAWREAGATDEEVSALCDIAMEGDRGVVEKLGFLELDLQKTIAYGDECCLMRITSKV